MLLSSGDCGPSLEIPGPVSSIVGAQVLDESVLPLIEHRVLSRLVDGNGRVQADSREENWVGEPSSESGRECCSSLHDTYTAIQVILVTDVGRAGA